jgi:hypothetical protein
MLVSGRASRSMRGRRLCALGMRDSSILSANGTVSAFEDLRSAIETLFLPCAAAHTVSSGRRAPSGFKMRTILDAQSPLSDHHSDGSSTLM